MKGLSIGWDDPVEVARKAIEDSLQDVDDGDGVLILTDMFGGTPTNLSLAFLEKGRVEIVTGVNLPMLIKYANHRENYSLTRAAEELASQGRDAIHVASVLLGNDTDAE
jgi:PTS system mannose-specific IIA component